MTEPNGNGAAVVNDDTKSYTVLEPVDGGYKTVHKGDYPTPVAALEAVARDEQLSDGETASYAVVASKFLKPRTAKVEVERRLVFS